MALNACYVCIDWTLICMLRYVEEYTQSFRRIQTARNIFYGAAEVQCSWRGVCFSTFFPGGGCAVGGETFYMASGYRWPFAIHLIIVYLLTLLRVVALIAKVRKNPGFYRVQNLVVRGLFLLTFGARCYQQEFLVFSVIRGIYHIILRLTGRRCDRWDGED